MNPITFRARNFRRLEHVAWSPAGVCVRHPPKCGGDNAPPARVIPENLCLAELGLTRSVEVGVYDDLARTPQPVRARMGARFLDWQLTQTPEESWAERERHAKAILEGTPAPAAAQPAPPSAPPPTPSAPQQSLFSRPVNERHPPRGPAMISPKYPGTRQVRQRLPPSIDARLVGMARRSAIAGANIATEAS